MMKKRQRTPRREVNLCSFSWSIGIPLALFNLNELVTEEAHEALAA